MSLLGKEYWEQHKTKYPFHAVRPIGDPRPEDYKPGVSMHIVCPIDGVAYWGFETENELKEFELQAGEARGNVL